MLLARRLNGTLWLALGLLAASVAMAQTPRAAPARPAERSTQLTVRGPGGQSVAFTAAEIAALPHTSVTVHNAHTKATESYAGVELATLLARVGVAQGEKVRGTLFLLGVAAHGTDGYTVLYSLAEVDPAIHTGTVMVADHMNGQPIAADGAFKLIATGDRRPARWVRNLDAITVFQVAVP